MRTRLTPFAALLLVGVPLCANAQVETVSRVADFFNIFVGLMLTAALGLYVIGVAMWFIRLGSWPSYRTTAIKVLEWAVAILFVLVVLLAIVQFFQNHMQAASYVISLIVVIVIIWVVVYLIVHSGGADAEKKEEEH